ncbi:MAG: virulence factor family protein [Chitinophagaceae bacterium]|nr:virulence factor family protein [Chitinophagaceae bacterium]
MKKNIYFLLIMNVFLFAGTAQKSVLPVKEWSASVESPFVLYISGDGGFNSFSTTLCNAFSKGGYGVTAVNSKTYFWDKKTPEQTSRDISEYLDKQFKGRVNQQLVLVGYSFGADVMPFIVNRLDTLLKPKLVSVVLISPSTSTDFEIHWSDMFGGNAKRSMDVLAEINKMDAPKVATFFGAEEGNFPVKDIQLKNYDNQTLPGGHRFDGHTDELAIALMKEFK